MGENVPEHVLQDAVRIRETYWMPWRWLALVMGEKHDVWYSDRWWEEVLVGGGRCRRKPRSPAQQAALARSRSLRRVRHTDAVV